MSKSDSCSVKYTGIFPLNLKVMSLFSGSVVSDSVIPWTAACQASVSFTVSQNLLRLMSFESVMESNHLILCVETLRSRITG